VLRNLLREGVSIRNMPAILEALADHVGAPRMSISSPSSCANASAARCASSTPTSAGTVHAVTLDPAHRVASGRRRGGSDDPRAEPVSPAYLQRLVERIGDHGARDRRAADVVLLVRSNVRRS
jgi:flagellar biosynthesis component FlhA